MSEKEQYKKVKLYRTLKIVFYCLGLPLFMFAVFTACVKFIGHDPFLGESGDMFGRYQAILTSPALYGIWVGAGIWAFIAVFQIVFHYVIKNRRARLMVTVMVILVTMLGSMLIMDTAFTKNFETMAKNAPAGVTVNDYKTELSYYNTVTTGVKNNSEKLMDQIKKLMTVYNVEYYGQDKNGTASNTGNDAVYYDTIVADDGTVGVDFDNNGIIDHNPWGDHRIIKTASLEFGNGKTYSHYFSVVRNINGTDTYVWYATDMMATLRDGIFGEATYNQTGLFSDGWVPSIDNVLKILSTYYGAKEKAEAIIKNAQLESFDTLYARYKEEALERQAEYYEYDADPWLKSIWNQEVEVAPNFSLTRSELNSLIGVVGQMLGDNKLFDFLLSPTAGGGIAEIIWPIVKKLAPGIGLKTLIGDSAAGTIDTIAGILSKDFVAQVPAQDKDNKKVSYDLQLALRYKTDDYANIENPDDKPDLKNDEKFGLTGKGADSLYVRLVTMRTTEITSNVTNSDGTVTQDKTYTYEFDAPALELDCGNPDTSDGNAFLDRISSLLNGVVNSAVSEGTLSTIKTVVDLVDGLGIIGIKLGDFFDDNGAFYIDITAILTNLLDTLYWYQSPVIKPVYMFYIDEGFRPGDNTYELQKLFMEYDMAYYTGAKYASMIGSTIIGDNLGDGNYPAALGITSAAQADQLLLELSYKPTYYPLFAVRDMLEIFTGIVIFCTFISFIFGEKEFEWATGAVDESGLKKKKKGNKKNKSEKDGDTDDFDGITKGVSGSDTAFGEDKKANDGSSGDFALNVGENTDKEVK